MKTTEWDPGKLFDLSGSYWQSCTIHAGTKLDVFTAIGNDSLSSDVIAEKINSKKQRKGRE